MKGIEKRETNFPEFFRDQFWRENLNFELMSKQKHSSLVDFAKNSQSQAEFPWLTFDIYINKFPRKKSYNMAAENEEIYISS